MPAKRSSPRKRSTKAATPRPVYYIFDNRANCEKDDHSLNAAGVPPEPGA